VTRATRPPTSTELVVLPACIVVRRWREAKGWTQRQAAAWYGVTERHWRRYEAHGFRWNPRLRRALLASWPKGR
jgi:hypothetical protein